MYADLIAEMKKVTIKTAADGKTELEKVKTEGTACLKKLLEQRRNFACVRTSGNADGIWDTAKSQWKMTGVDCLAALMEEPKCFTFLPVVANAQLVRSVDALKTCFSAATPNCPTAVNNDIPF